MRPIDPIRAIVAIPFDEERHPYSAQMMYSPVSPAPLPEGSRFRDNPAGYVGMGWGIRKRPRPEDRLTFEDDQPDENGLPGIRIAYELTDVEEADFERARKHQARAAAALGEFVDGMPKVMPAGSSLHYMGTVRMGPADDGTSVCDSVLAGVGRARPRPGRQRPHPDRQLDEPHADQRRHRRPRCRGARRRPHREGLTVLDFPIIQGRGFRNVVENGRVTGFSFQLRNPNYRGGAASMLDGIEVVVDGERIPDHVPLWTLQGRTLTLDELRASTDVRWQLDEPATITVPKPGGLSVGVHQLEVTVYLRRSYFPPHGGAVPVRRDRVGRDRARRCRTAACATASRPTATPVTSTPR